MIDTQGKDWVSPRFARPSSLSHPSVRVSRTMCKPLGAPACDMQSAESSSLGEQDWLGVQKLQQPLSLGPGLICMQWLYKTGVFRVCGCAGLGSGCKCSESNRGRWGQTGPAACSNRQVVGRFIMLSIGLIVQRSSTLTSSEATHPVCWSIVLPISQRSSPAAASQVAQHLFGYINLVLKLLCCSSRSVLQLGPGVAPSCTKRDCVDNVLLNHLLMKN